MKKKINKNIPKYKFGAAEVSNAVSVGASGIAGMAGISQDSAVGGALKGLGAGLSSIPTPYTQIAGAALSTVGSFWGEAGSVNQQTGEIDYGSGLSKVFGRSKNSLRRESNRIKNSLVDRELTEKLNYDYYNDPNHSANMNVFAAAEGAVVRKPVLAKVSPGELRIDPNTLKYEEIPGDGGKPNADDNVTKILGEGEIIASNAEHMKMPNGKTPADNAKIILDSNMSEQQKKKMIKKLTNWQEANKTELQNDIKYSEGSSFIKRARERGYNQNWESDILKNPIAQQLFGQNKKYKLFTPQEAVERAGYNYGPSFANYNADLGIPGFQNVTNILNNYSNFIPKKGGGHTRSNASSVQQSTTTDTPAIKPKTLTAPVYTQTKTDITMGRNKLPEMSKQLPKVDIKQSTGENKKSNINWLDYLNLMGPLANIFSSKPEKVNVYAPRREYGPTYYNEKPIIEQIGLNRAITNYNAAKKTPNTGAGMQFALQSQMNTDKAIGTALANKENIQNQYAFQNANIYNQWSDVYANAKHTAAVEQAQNDAAARNIKRKGVGDLFTNAGKIARDRGLTKRDEGLYQAMLPYLEYGMTSEQLKKLTELYS